jgi:hypothetical protein
LHNPAAFTSPVDEVVAWGEDTWPLGWGLWEAPARLFFCQHNVCSSLSWRARIALDLTFHQRRIGTPKIELERAGAVTGILLATKHGSFQ